MPVPDISGVPPFADFDMLKNKINDIVQKYNNLLVSMDSLNVVSLTADHIDSGTINAGVVTVRADYDSGAYIEIGPTGMKIYDGSKFTFSVDISGNVTMTGATVQSTAGYPKVVLDPNSNQFGVYASTTNYIFFDPTINPSFNAPEIGWRNSGSGANIYLTPFLFNVQSTTDISIQTSTLLDLDAGTISFPNWSTIFSNGEGQTLPQYINNSINGAVSGFTGTVVTPDYNFTYVNGLLKSVT